MYDISNYIINHKTLFVFYFQAIPIALEMWPFNKSILLCNGYITMRLNQRAWTLAHCHSSSIICFSTNILHSQQ